MGAFQAATPSLDVAIATAGYGGLLDLPREFMDAVGQRWRVDNSGKRAEPLG